MWSEEDSNSIYKNNGLELDNSRVKKTWKQVLFLKLCKKSHQIIYQRITMVTMTTNTFVVDLLNFQNHGLVDISFQSLFVVPILVLFLVVTQNLKKNRQEPFVL